MPHLVLLYFGNLLSVQGYLIATSKATDEIEHLFMYLLPGWISFHFMVFLEASIQIFCLFSISFFVFVVDASGASVTLI